MINVHFYIMDVHITKKLLILVVPYKIYIHVDHLSLLSIILGNIKFIELPITKKLIRSVISNVLEYYIS